MIWLALGLLLLGLFLGGAGMRRHLRVAGATWRPAAGVLAIVAMVGAGILAVAERWLPAVLLLVLAAFFSVSARKRGATARQAPARISMSVADAAALLGVPADADAKTVQAAYLRLMKMAHPDSGGTSGLAAQLNAARETMLKRKG